MDFHHPPVLPQDRLPGPALKALAKGAGRVAQLTHAQLVLLQVLHQGCRQGCEERFLIQGAKAIQWIGCKAIQWMGSQSMSTRVIFAVIFYG